MGSRHILGDKTPDLVLSGVNRGRNVAEDVVYSGTIAGALEGTILGIPSFALSQEFSIETRHAPLWETALKFGPGGTYDPARPGPFRDNARIKRQIERYSPEFIEILAEVAQYLHDTFGKFPATLPSILVRMYAQAQHIDLDFYDRFYGPESYLETHREHMARWHAP